MREYNSEQNVHTQKTYISFSHAGKPVIELIRSDQSFCCQHEHNISVFIVLDHSKGQVVISTGLHSNSEVKLNVV